MGDRRRGKKAGARAFIVVPMGRVSRISDLKSASLNNISQAQGVAVAPSYLVPGPGGLAQEILT